MHLSLFYVPFVISDCPIESVLLRRIRQVWTSTESIPPFPLVSHYFWNYQTLITFWISRSYLSGASAAWLLDQHFVKTNPEPNMENYKVPHYWPQDEDSLPVKSGFPSQRASKVCLYHEDVIKWKHFRVTGPL